MSRHLHRSRLVSAGPRAQSVAQAIRWLLAAFALTASGLVQAQAWPTRSVRIVVPFSAGATTDLLARILGEQLSQKTGQSFVVDNKLGASGALASVEVARAPADGHTLLLTTSSTHSVAPAMSNRLQYDAVEDFTPIAHVADSQLVMLVSPTVAARNVGELLALAREKPGFVNYSSSGIGTAGHLSSEALAAQANVLLTHIPYKGSAQALPDLMGGVVQLTWDALATGLPHVKEGRVRGMAVSGPRRSPLAPEIPTVAESGLPGFSVVLWFGLYGPRGIPTKLAERINAEVNKVLQSPDVRDRFARMGIEAGHGSPADFAAVVANDRARWARIVSERKLKPAE